MEPVELDPGAVDHVCAVEEASEVLKDSELGGEEDEYDIEGCQFDVDSAVHGGGLLGALSLSRSLRGHLL